MATWKTPKLKRLARVLAQTDEEAVMLQFLRDLCTLEELRELSSRWEVVELLNKKIPYREIAEKTGVSTATITRIAQFLHHGEGGYKKVLKQ